MQFTDTIFNSYCNNLPLPRSRHWTVQTRLGDSASHIGNYMECMYFFIWLFPLISTYFGTLFCMSQTVVYSYCNLCSFYVLIYISVLIFNLWSLKTLCYFDIIISYHNIMLQMHIQSLSMKNMYWNFLHSQRQNRKWLIKRCCSGVFPIVKG